MKIEVPVWNLLGRKSSTLKLWKLRGKPGWHTRRILLNPCYNRRCMKVETQKQVAWWGKGQEQGILVPPSWCYSSLLNTIYIFTRARSAALRTLCSLSGNHQYALGAYLMYEAMPHQFCWCFLPSYTLFMWFACNVGLMFSESIVYVTPDQND